MIRLSGVSYTYPRADEPALDAVDLDVSDGDFLLVCGRSGTGKSTLLRTLNGLVPHHSGGVFAGSVEVGGRDVTGLPPRELAGLVGFVPQDPEAHATAEMVVPELAFAMENLGVEPVRMRKRIEETLDQLGIGHLRDRRLETLSGGERQRVAIAAVLALQPRVLVLDEPTSALDPRSAEDVLSVLVRLRDDLGLTVVCSEHRLERIASFCDRVAHLNGGAPEIGHPRDVFARVGDKPPVTELGQRMGWEPLPLTVREGRRFASSVAASPPAVEPPAPADPVLGCERVNVTLGGSEVLAGASLGLAAGEITALVGRNGSGKTTLCRVLARLADPSSGALVGPLADLGGREYARRVAYVPQRAEALLFRDTVADELPSEVWRERLGLQGLADRHPWTLSAGQRLWTALGTAFARSPDVYVLDEPTRGLDPHAKDRLAMLLRAEADRGAAVLLVTHDVELVARTADRVAMFAAGEVVASGPTREVLGESLLFSSQTSKVMGDARFLTPDDVVGR